MVTAIADALRKAGAPVEESRLFATATEIVRLFGTSQIAVAKLLDVVEKDRDLLKAMVALFLRDRAQDIEFSSQGEASGQVGDAKSQISVAAREVEGEGAKTGSPSGLSSCAPSPSPKHDGKGHWQGANAGRPPHAQPVVPAKPRERSEAERLAARSAFSLASKSILDTYRLSSGELLADLRFGQLAARESASMKDAIVIRLVRQHCIAPPEVKVRDAIKAEQLRIFVDQAGDETKEIARAR